ncbi:MAG: response regulator transcription factor [Bifidobacterium sp.]|uniref:Response regulator transcription factor n=1 Tax=Bifidobacterium fermentum TaxID=3059035 RepID=A0AB39UE03_9BIFI
MNNGDGLISVGIADDQDLVRAGFAMVINSQPDMRVVCQASDGEEIVSQCRRFHPDVVLMDVRMPGLDGIGATTQITASDEHASTHVIILTTFDLDEYVMSAINAGASGFLLKDTEPETLLSSIRTVYQGNAIIAPTATKRLVEHMMETGFAEDSWDNSQSPSSAPQPSMVQSGASTFQGMDRADAPAASSASKSRMPYQDRELDELTEREREVLIEISHGLSNQEIAEKLFISLPTVKTHVAHILQKIHARDRVQAVVFAYENHLV